ncbi:hypothetical protein RchiOBHm_Chr7g0215431 [Rosa chinensis]|uniref:Uncharacterized protein n=1 Tax=Rosa chinensis TaxID=74649 RepID=A0A2P6PBG9_ROSCH|nr:hypothetical protein RchiOBHm_Chr7g0215431 [Rosa chinensis]
MRKWSFPGPTRNPSQRRNPDEARKPEGTRKPHGLKMTLEILWEIKSDFCMGNDGYNVKIKEITLRKSWESFMGLCNKKRLKTSPDSSTLNPGIERSLLAIY